MSSTRIEMACQQCHLPLNTLGGPDNPRYIHPLASGIRDHQPEPVPASQLDTLARQCDFCGDTYPLWTLVGGEVAAVAMGDQDGLWQNYGDRWAACATCERLIRLGRANAVVDRAAATFAWSGVPEAHQRIAQLHQAFLSALRPGRTLITTTAWPAATLQPHDLPKVRDRLTRLYRTPDTLPDPYTEVDLRHPVADSLDRAKLYWIDPDFTDLVEHAATHLPDTAIAADDPPAADGLLVWSRPVTARQIAAASWTADADPSHRIVCYRHIGAGLDNATLQQVREQVGWLAPTTTTTAVAGEALPSGGLAAALVATWLLIAQQVADTVAADLDRATRKSYARQQRPAPEVRIVRIKARPSRAARTTAAAGAGRGPLQQREWVGEHWKQQVFGPGRSQRKLIYVAPYLRGPDDTPIRASTTVRVLGSARRPRPTEKEPHPDTD